MARLRKPEGTHLIDGTRAQRADVARGHDLQLKSGLGPPPAHLTAREREVWTRVRTEIPPSVLRSVDEFILAAFCFAVAVHDEAAAKLREGTLLIRQPNGKVVQLPYVTIVNRQAVLIKTLGADLGLSPAARTRISMTAGEEAAPHAH